MENKYQNGVRYIPSMETVKQAAAELPSAESFRGEKYHASVGDERLIEFRRVKMKTKKGRVYRWIYDGKIMIS